MSKVLFSADWHIKLGQKNVPAPFQINRFRELFKKLHVLEQDVDYHIIGGDIFDRVPSMEELELFFEYVKGVTTPVFIYDGNHEASKKGSTFFKQLQTIITNPLVTVLLGSSNIRDEIDIIPYTKLKTFNPDNFSRRILATHVRGEIPPHVKPEINLDKLDRWEIVLAGDLHSHTNCQRNIVYPGSPLTTSFHRSKPKTGVVVLDTDSLEYEWIGLKLPQLIRKTVDNEEDMVKTDYDHTIYELVGDIEGLAKMKKANPLLDKKVVSRNVGAKIDFSKISSVVEELVLYLTEVQQVKATDKYVEVYNDYIQET